MKSILIVGSALDAQRMTTWDLSSFSKCVVINNAWQLTDNWDYLIYPDDMPQKNRPFADNLKVTQSLITSREYVPVQNHFGGFVYAGGTMAFTAGYWALGALKPDIIAYLGCDMIYPEEKDKESHFYGHGQADPLRSDVTLQSLEAKSIRLMALAQKNHCVMVNLSELPESRLQFPRAPAERFLLKTSPPIISDEYKMQLDERAVSNALQAEKELGCMVTSGRYWEVAEHLDAKKLSAIDALWIDSVLAKK
ncbi:hypothetical protein N9K12_01305 [Methylophilaceae bacterium]|nr:hypothetical protein [Methylophilaceae bacterium]